MKNSIIKYLSKHFAPRWGVYLFDTIVIFLCYVLTFFLRLFLVGDVFNYNLFHHQVIIIVPAYFISFYIFKPYFGIVRLSTLKDLTKIIMALSFGLLLVGAIIILRREVFLIPDRILSIPFLIVHYFGSMSVLIISRVIVKTIFREMKSEKRPMRHVLIFGAGVMGQLTRNAIEKEDGSNYKVIGFVDDNRSLQGKSIFTIPIYGLNKDCERIIRVKNIKEMVIAINKDRIKQARKREITDFCIKNKLVIKEIPEVSNWLNGELHPDQFRRVRIEDLLSRDTIKLDERRIQQGLKDATILVTGAAGSIGSEIVRQLLTFKTKKVILLDQAESGLYDLQNEINSKFRNADFELFLADVTNYYRMKQLFEKYHPDIIFNAAAYKHVPMMEENPYEAIRVNVGGVKNLADLAVEYGVHKFVMVSTDKAVNPTNVMGASKRICEMYVQGLSQRMVKTRFITTRFGNVLGSNGSVIPLFKKQIEAGGPVTVTHRDITRYFMTISEACQLVLEAGFMGHGGEIFLFDMGEPVRIYDLAVKMISLSGYEPHAQIPIVFTGLRPGEKLYEELLASKENTLPTYNEKIMIGQVQRHEYSEVNSKITALLSALNEENEDQLVARMKNLVPEYISHNSKFSVQDKKEAVSPRRIYQPVPHVSPNVVFAAGRLRIR